MASPSPKPLTYDVTSLTVQDFFGYTPSVALAATALGLYVSASILVAVFVFAYKRSRYMHIVTLTGLMEAGGYAALLYAIFTSGKGNIYGAYVAMQVLIILAPNLLQATDYWTVSKVVYAGGLSDYTWLYRPRVLRSFFIMADLSALIVQAVGISIWAGSQGSGNPNQAKIKVGSIITLVGLTLQLVFFIFFVLLTIRIQRQLKNVFNDKRGYVQLFVGIYLTVTFITIRNIFRWAEFLQSTLLSWPPPTGTYVAAKQQSLFYALDTLPILLAFLSFIVFHPSRLLPETQAASQFAV